MNTQKSTNNLAEQAIGEPAIIRKIIGTFRSENGADNYGYIAFLLPKRRIKGKSMFVGIDRILREELSGLG